MEKKPIISQNPPTFEELYSYIEELLELNDFHAIEKAIYQHTLILVDQQTNKEPTFILYQRILKAIEKSSKTHNPLKVLILNGLGVISDGIGLTKEAINFYLLGLLCSEGNQEYLSYNNIGACFADLPDYTVARVYSQKAMDSNAYGPKKKKRTDRIYNLSMTNLAIANINLGNIKEAEKRLNEVHISSSTIVANLHNYAVWLLKVASYQNNIEGAIAYIKELEKDTSKLPYIYYLKKYLIDEVKGIPIVKQYPILLECFELHDLLANLSDKKRTILSLITLSKKLGKKTDEVKFKEALFELSMLEVTSNTTITRILVEQYLLFFNDLSQSNQKTKRQNEELTKLTFLLSHNLKTPVRNISGFTDLTRKKLLNQVDEETEDYFNHVIKNCNDLYSLLNNINQMVHYRNKAASSSNSGLQHLINELEEKLSGNI